MVSIEIADKFLTQILDIPNWTELFTNNKLGLLKIIVLKHVEKLVFQNITMVTTEPEKRTQPTIESVINSAFSGKGGVCIEQNYFLKMVLEKIGFESYTLAATWSASKIPKTHCVTLVKMGQKVSYKSDQVVDEMYLVDVSCGHPIHEPIPLHNLPYTGWAAGYKYEYRYDHIEKLFWRNQAIGSYFTGPYENGKISEPRYYFDLTHCEFTDFENQMKIFFTDPERSYLLRMPFLFRYLKVPQNPERNEDLHFIMVWGRKMVEGTAQVRNYREFKTYREIQPIFEKYFGEIGFDEIEKAICIYEQHPMEKDRF